MANWQDLSYWAKTPPELFQSLESSQAGLSSEEAQKRLQFFGPNELAKRKKRTILTSFLAKFLNPLIIILLLASLVSAFLGQIIDFLLIATMILISVVIDFYQQHQAEESAEKLRQKVALTAAVLRDGQKKEVLITQIIPGDIVLLAAGDIVPADARLISARDLIINQSALSGESFPQEKEADKVVGQQVSLPEKINSVFMGTNVISGEGMALVCATGVFSEFGKVAQQLVAKRLPSEFERGVKDFGHLLVRIILALVIFVFFINALIRHEVLNSLLFALALAVGLTPELLPMIMTINLAKGATRMSKKGVIVKDLPAIQNFGSMDVLCTDKTGTLTEDKIQLEIYEDLDKKVSPEVLLYGFLNSFYQTGLKNPMEEAVLKHQEVDIKDFSKVDEIPFDFVRKRLSVVVKKGKKNLLVTKGTPEGIIAISNHYFEHGQVKPLSLQKKEKIQERFKDLSQQGFRVLAVGLKEIGEKKSYLAKDEEGLSLLGLMAFLDPPKASAKEALRILEKQGITVKILTGDNEIVTEKVCQELALPVLAVIKGEEVDTLADDALVAVAEKTTIFARLDPNQKNRVILALKKNNHVVGYLGDGINDAPSLRAADVGISVDNAVDVAKESADLILLQKDLHVLKEGVYEGRTTYGNIMKYIMMETSSSFGNMFSLAGASLFLSFLPMLPIQILLNNLLYDISQLSIAGDRVATEYLNQPKKWNVNFIKHFMFVFGPISSLFDFLTFFILLFVFRATIPLFQTGWFLESLLTQTLIVFSIRTQAVPFYNSRPTKLLGLSALLVAGVALILPYLPFARLFAFTKPPPAFYLVLLVVIVFYFLLVEAAKHFFYRRYQP